MSATRSLAWPRTGGQQTAPRRGLGLWILAIWIVFGAPVLEAQTGATGTPAPDRVAHPPTLNTPQGTIELLPVPAPDLSDTEAEVQAAIREHRGALAQRLARTAPDLNKLAEAYGKLGALYQAHNIYGPAQPSYLNAEHLAPDNFRWPYLLGYLGQQTTQLGLAEQAFLRALRLDPDDGPARLRLAQGYVEMDRLGEASKRLERTFADPGMAAAVLFEKGKIAVSEKHYDDAVRYLEAALKTQPLANRIHYPLAMAYRALGEVDRAKGHVAKFGNGKPSIPDPVVEKNWTHSCAEATSSSTAACSRCRRASTSRRSRPSPRPSRPIPTTSTSGSASPGPSTWRGTARAPTGSLPRPDPRLSARELLLNDHSNFPVRL